MYFAYASLPDSTPDEAFELAYRVALMANFVAGAYVSTFFAMVDGHSRKRVCLSPSVTVHFLHNIFSSPDH